MQARSLLGCGGRFVPGTSEEALLSEAAWAALDRIYMQHPDHVVAEAEPRFITVRASQRWSKDIRANLYVPAIVASQNRGHGSSKESVTFLLSNAHDSWALMLNNSDGQDRKMNVSA